MLMAFMTKMFVVSNTLNLTWSLFKFWDNEINSVQHGS
jgi:hypothetical protein